MSKEDIRVWLKHKNYKQIKQDSKNNMIADNFNIEK